MNIKTFKDGERLVIVVEGLTTFPTDESLLKGLLSGISDGDVEAYPEADAIPLPVAEEEPCIIVGTSFYAGPLDGALPLIDSVKKELELLSSLGDNAELYLRYKFSKLDADAYASKLSVQQKEKFFETYGKYLPAPLLEEKDVKKVIEYYSEC
ncbi:MAG: hypothetical protein J6I68_05460 [Butyrivibrio sp.]|uniref:hypothetical protein n=1 Tax=Butyrivibrio sp. TaxID=28121 RepID=UPI001B23A6D9|nr:hypothetical protein [Butyrivibrio sp.]MBO5620156.1 hypothetical protein [Butyrivibrio sp.]MBP3782677.1 hypothetical protein [Butyrivibrio sp.]